MADVLAWDFNDIALTKNTYRGPTFPWDNVETIRLDIREWKVDAEQEEACRLRDQASLQASTYHFKSLGWQCRLLHLYLHGQAHEQNLMLPLMQTCHLPVSALAYQARFVHLDSIGCCVLSDGLFPAAL